MHNFGLILVKVGANSKKEQTVLCRCSVNLARMRLEPITSLIISLVEEPLPAQATKELPWFSKSAALRDAFKSSPQSLDTSSGFSVYVEYP